MQSEDDSNRSTQAQCTDASADLVVAIATPLFAERQSAERLSSLSQWADTRAADGFSADADFVPAAKLPVPVTEL